MTQKLKISSTLRCNVLIIGAGGAGLRCASAVLEKKPGTHIIAVTKVANPQKSHTQTAQGPSPSRAFCSRGDITVWSGVPVFRAQIKATGTIKQRESKNRDFQSMGSHFLVEDR